MQSDRARPAGNRGARALTYLHPAAMPTPPTVPARAIAAALALTALGAAAQTPLEWTRSILTGFTWYTSDAPQLFRAPDSDLLVAGNTLEGASESDFLIARYTDSGDALWTFTWDGPSGSYDHLAAAAVDAAGAVIATGYARVDSADTDLAVIKVTPDGEAAWTYTFDGGVQRPDAGVAIALDADGSIYVTGYAAIDTLRPAKLLVQKLSPEGALLWAHVLGAADEYDCSGRLVKVLDDGIRVLGHYWPYIGSAGFTQTVVSADGTLIAHAEGPGIQGFGSAQCYAIDDDGYGYAGVFGRYRIMRIRPDATTDWLYEHPSNLPWNVSADECNALAIDAEGSIRATGRIAGPDYLGPTYTNCDVLTLKLDASGTLAWSDRYAYQDANSCDMGNAIALDDALNAYAAGQSQHAGITTHYDFSITKVSPEGTLIGELRYDGPDSGDDALTSIAVTPSAIYVAGISMDAAGRSHLVTQKYSNTVGMAEAAAPLIGAPSPNPFSARFLLETGPGARDADLVLTDIHGRTVRRLGRPQGERMTVERDGLPAGIYVLLALRHGAPVLARRVVAE